MAKKKVKQAKDKVVVESTESAPTTEAVEESDEVLEVVKTKPTKEDKKKAKEAKNNKVSKKKAKNSKPRRNFFKEVFSELKKVNWPTFKQACKQTGAVLVVVAVFMVVVLGIDMLLAWLMSLVVG